MCGEREREREYKEREREKQNQEFKNKYTRDNYLGSLLLLIIYLHNIIYKDCVYGCGH